MYKQTRNILDRDQYPRALFSPIFLQSYSMLQHYSIYA